MRDREVRASGPSGWTSGSVGGRTEAVTPVGEPRQNGQLKRPWLHAMWNRCPHPIQERIVDIPPASPSASIFSRHIAHLSAFALPVPFPSSSSDSLTPITTESSAPPPKLLPFSDPSCLLPSVHLSKPLCFVLGLCMQTQQHGKSKGKMSRKITFFYHLQGRTAGELQGQTPPAITNSSGSEMITGWTLIEVSGCFRLSGVLSS